MGKSKKPNRTKNNARPSSSARSAELLENQAPTFFGMAMKGGPISMLPGIPTVTDEMDSGIDVNYQLVLKKMVKKDPITKIKALKEFTDMCDKAEAKDVKSVLPFWPRLYCQLCNDTEHRVREAAHQSHKAVVSKVKKALAPYLKEIIGPWFTSQYDNYPPAATAAVASFQEAFSPTKMAEAITFCQDDILEYIVNNLIVQTPQTLSNPKTTSEEEMEAKYQRVVSSSLLGYALYLEKMSHEQLKEKVESNKRLLVSAKFWKFGNNKDPLIRYSFYTAINSLFVHGSFLFTGDNMRASSAILNNLGEKDPLVLPVVWNVVLHGLVAIPECWNHPNVEKQLLPKLFTILRNGGEGHAASIFPTILPLISQIQPKITGDKSEFYDKLFSSMKCGLEAPNVNRSQSESRVVAETFVECVKYISLLQLRDSDSISKIAYEHLLGAVRSRLLNGNGPQHTTKPFFFHVALLLRFWHRSSYQVIDTFWLELEALLESMLTNTLSQNDIDELLKNQMQFMTILLTPSKYVPRSGRERVKFAEKSAEESTVKPIEIAVAGFDEACLKCGKKLAAFYFKRFKLLGETLFLKSALELSKIFDSFSVLGELIGDLSLVEKNIPRELMVEINTQILPHIPEIEQERLLKELSVVPDDTVPLLCHEVLKNPTSVVKNWIRGSRFSEIYLRLLNSFLEGSSESSTGDILKQFFETEILLSDDAMRLVMETLTSAVNKENTKPEWVLPIAVAWPGALSSTQEFERFIVSLYESSHDSDVYLQLLRQMLQKVKYYRAVEPNVWRCLFEAMASLEIACSDASRRVRVIVTMLEVATDVDLAEACDSDEIGQVLPFVATFLEPTHSIMKHRRIILRITQLAREYDGIVNLSYFRLKANQLRAVDLKKCNNEIIKPLLDNADYFPIANESLPWPDELNFQLTDTASAYAQWVIFCSSLINSVLKAYPRFSKIDSLEEEGSYVIVSNEEYGSIDLSSEPVGDQTLSSDKGVVISRKITSEMLKDLKEERKMLLSLYDDDEYPDINTITPLLNIVLEVIEGFVALKELSKSEAFPYVIDSTDAQLLQSVFSITENVTPIEFEYLHNHCKELVNKDPQWYLFRITIQNLFHRWMVPVEAHFSKESFETDWNHLMSETLSGKPERFLFLNAMIKDSPSYFTSNNWNDIFIQLDNAIKSLLSREELDESQIFEAGAIARVYLTLHNLFTNPLGEESQPDFDPEIPKIWAEVVENDLRSQLLSAWKSICLTSSSQSEEEPVTSLVKVEYFVPLVTFCTAIQIGLEPSSLEQNDFTDFEMIELCSIRLLSPLPPVRATAFEFFRKYLSRALAAADMKIFQASSDDIEDDDKFSHARDCPWKVKLLQPVLVTAQTIVEALLSDFKIGDTCSLQPFTDSFTYAHGYLLIWNVIAEVCSEAHSALRFQYAQWLKQSGHLVTFLNSVFKLMPASVLQGEDYRNPSKYFEIEQNFKDVMLPRSLCIQMLACCSYRQILQSLPAAVREWWGEIDHHSSNLVAYVTKTHVSPFLIAWELKEVLNIGVDLDNMSVVTSAPSREVVATYKVDEAVMQIVIALPANYPLSTVKVDLNNGPAVARGSRILLFLVHRNGSLRDALAMWKSDLDKKYEGLEECEICFSILHGPNMEIPKQGCKTCRKKFHSACLYKWFSMSNKSSCPHCRNLY